ncbi:hypothetical protein F0726_00123 [Acidithiobacillus caldus]|nr:hypothetical protein F0726_00123 [Acidithiobacillus caldus]
MSFFKRFTSHCVFNGPHQNLIAGGQVDNRSGSMEKRTNFILYTKDNRYYAKPANNPPWKRAGWIGYFRESDFTIITTSIDSFAADIQNIGNTHSNTSSIKKKYNHCTNREAIPQAPCTQHK